MSDLLAEELNVKEVQFRDNEEDLVEYSAVANFKVLGRLLGRDMKAAAERISRLNSGEIRTLNSGGTLSVDFDGTESKVLNLTSEAVEIRRSEKAGLKVLNEGSLTIALDPEITPELLAEGLVRDLVRGIQSLRKDSGFDVTDRIAVEIDAPPEIRNAVNGHAPYMMAETLAGSMEWLSPVKGKDAARISVGDSEITVAVRVVK
jgi:isoleucyl-tRNA synthetase